MPERHRLNQNTSDCVRCWRNEEHVSSAIYKAPTILKLSKHYGISFGPVKSPTMRSARCAHCRPSDGREALDEVAGLVCLRCRHWVRRVPRDVGRLLRSPSVKL